MEIQKKTKVHAKNLTLALLEIVVLGVGLAFHPPIERTNEGVLP